MVFNKTRLQKIAIIVVLVAAGVLLISSLGFTHEAWNAIRYRGVPDEMGSNNFFGQGLNYQSTIGDYDTCVKFYYKIWDDVQAANNAFFYTAIFGFICIAAACIAGNFSRRKYYISNLVCGLLYPVLTVIMSIVAIVKTAVVSSDFAKAATDFSNYYDKQIVEAQEYGKSIDTIQKINADGIQYFYVLAILSIIVAVAFAVIMILKFKKTYPGKIGLENKEFDSVATDSNVDENKISNKEVVSNE